MLNPVDEWRAHWRVYREVQADRYRDMWGRYRRPAVSGAWLAWLGRWLVALGRRLEARYEGPPVPGEGRLAWPVDPRPGG